ncbi:PREDICTED: protein MEMO1-like [Priapulus caudatus]|uniref:Protein MEMO1-like n=1 Tax=Priapulus caudatus TaxID=37621 RepID=A0ABM1EZM2_PRICU|nr:PREDICTED: protein MEMO1-like [Priapulus caudatus]
MSNRRATHAGSWYTDNSRELEQQLQKWLDKASGPHSPARAIIAPHAGYTYCGACSAFAYRQVDPVSVKRVFILGPSHHVRLSSCALSSCSTYKTPIYDLNIDQQVYDHLKATGSFEMMSRSTDEQEHSIEMQLPYIAKVMSRYAGLFTIVPVLVGSLPVEREQEYGEIFAHYLANPENLFVISSDFCHWGRRFRYTHYDQSRGEIYQSIEHLDRMGMDFIEKINPTGFADYLKTYQNTICGRHPIGVLLNALDTLRRNNTNGQRQTLRFLKYAQSSQCTSLNDSSVSYASAVLNMQ